MFTSGMLHLATAIAAVLLVALVITVLGVSDGAREPSTSRSSAQEWPERKSFAWLIASRSAVNMGIYFILPFLAFYLRFAQHVSNYLSKSLDFLLIIIGCAVVGTVPAGILGDRVSKKSILYVALALLGMGAAAFSLVEGVAKLLPIAAIIGLGWGAYYSVDWALACVLLPAGRAGALMAIWNIGASAPQVAAPIVGGLLIDRVGAITGDHALGYRLLFALFAVFMAMGAVGLGFVREPRAGLASRTG